MSSDIGINLDYIPGIYDIRILSSKLTLYSVDVLYGREI